MKAKTKTAMFDLAMSLKARGQLTATNFFMEARNSKWGKQLEGDVMVEGYNETLGRLFGSGQLTFEEVNQAMKP